MKLASHKRLGEADAYRFVTDEGDEYQIIITNAEKKAFGEMKALADAVARQAPPKPVA